MYPAVIFPKLNGPGTDQRAGEGHNLSCGLESVPWTAGVPSCRRRAEVGAGLRCVPWAREVSHRHNLEAAGYLPSMATTLPNHPVSREKYSLEPKQSTKEILVEKAPNLKLKALS